MRAMMPAITALSSARESALDWLSPEAVSHSSRFGADDIVIEDKSSGTQLIQDLQNEGLFNVVDVFVGQITIGISFGSAHGDAVLGEGPQFLDQASSSRFHFRVRNSTILGRPWKNSLRFRQAVSIV